MTLGPMLALLRASQAWACFHHLTIQVLIMLLLQEKETHAKVNPCISWLQWYLSVLFLYTAVTLLWGGICMFAFKIRFPPSLYSIKSCPWSLPPGIYNSIFLKHSSYSRTYDCTAKGLWEIILPFFCREWLFYSLTFLCHKIVTRVKWVIDVNSMKYYTVIFLTSQQPHLSRDSCFVKF